MGDVSILSFFLLLAFMVDSGVKSRNKIIKGFDFRGSEWICLFNSANENSERGGRPSQLGLRKIEQVIIWKVTGVDYFRRRNSHVKEKRETLSDRFDWRILTE